jgi:hypothetical protein
MHTKLCVHTDVLQARRRTSEKDQHKELWAAMQSLMTNVDKIEKKQDRMDSTVEKVRKIMRYSP